MATSIITIQRDVILNTIKSVAGNDWKALILDEETKRLVYNVVKEDDILNANITNIEQIELKRQSQHDTDAIYILSPRTHIVQILKFDLSRKKYRNSFLLWISTLPPALEQDLNQSESSRKRIALSRPLNVEYYPAESHVVTFREPWSFHALYHPNCDTLVKAHLDSLTQKILAVCVSLGEYPLVKYYKPREARHDAAVLCSHLASFVQNALDEYARDPRNDFPPQTSTQSAKPRAVLFITDRSMDLFSPIIHELTYQAMAMDLLNIRDDGLKLTYKNVIRKGTPDETEVDAELTEKDNLWVKHRHLHMKDLLVELSDQFKKFQAANPQFANTDGQNASINTIKDMLAGLPQFQEGKDAFALHIDMAEKLAKMFADRKMMDVVTLEQNLAIGLDEENRPPTRTADQLVRLLDDDSVIHEDRVRLLMMYVLFRHGILTSDIERLRCHGQLSPADGEVIFNLQPLGAKISRTLKDPISFPRPLFAPKLLDTTSQEEISVSRFEPALRYMLEEYSNDRLDSALFPAVKPHLEGSTSSASGPQTSLRSAGKPTWAQSQRQAQKPQQRIIVFIAGGATYAEARACYELSGKSRKEIFLATTHMLTPKLYIRQLGMLSANRKQLGLPMDAPPQQLPSWTSEPPPKPKEPPKPQPAAVSPQPANATRPLSSAMKNMNISGPPPAAIQPVSSNTTNGKKEKDKSHFGGLFKKHK